MQLATKLWKAVTSRGSSAAMTSEENALDQVEYALNSTCVATLSGHEDRVWSVAWHPTKRLLASCGGDKTIRIWTYDANNMADWTLVTTLEGEHRRTVRHVEWSPSGQRLACSSFDATVTIWKLRSDEDEGSNAELFEVVATLEGHDNEVKCCAWARDRPDDDLVATCARDKTVWIWERPSPDEDEGFECGGVLSGHSQDVKSVHWLTPSESPCGQRSLLSTSYDGTVKYWEENVRRKDDWHCVQTLAHGQLGTVWEVAVEPQSVGGALPRLCAGTEGGALRLWQPVTGGGTWKNLGDLSIADGPVYSVDWQKGVVAAATADNHVVFVRIFSSESRSGGSEDAPAPGQCEIVGRILNAHDSDVNSVRFAPAALSPDAAHVFVATAGDDDKVRIWSVERVLTSAVPADDKNPSTTTSEEAPTAAQ